MLPGMLTGNPANQKRCLVSPPLLIALMVLAIDIPTGRSELVSSQSAIVERVGRCIAGNFCRRGLFDPSAEDGRPSMTNLPVAWARHRKVNPDYPGDGVLNRDEMGFDGKGGTIGYVLQYGRFGTCYTAMMRGPPHPVISNSAFPPSSKKCIITPASSYSTNCIDAQPKGGV